MLGKFRCTKRYDHSEFSCCFRQWRAQSHCRLLHGYALSFKLTFEAIDLDANSWVLDFGSMKPIKAWLKDMFDHTTVVAHDDPQMQRFNALYEAGVISLRILPSVGCEMFAKHVFDHVADWLSKQPEEGRVTLVSVEVSEHGVNSAIYGDV